MIIYSNPFRSDKNIGKAYNEFIECLNVPLDTWIVIQDGDIAYLTDDWGKRIEDSIALDGNKFGLIGCKTNRIRGRHQLHEHIFSSDFNVKNHHEIAKEYNEIGIEPINRDDVIAGYLMAFTKRTWLMAGGFTEKTPSADAIFNEKVRNLGKQIGQFKNLYVFHCYRLWSDDPFTETKHLKI